MLIKNTIVLSPLTGKKFPADLLLRGGIIEKIAEPGTIPDSAAEEEIVDGTNCICAPGLIDVHVHFRDPGYTWKEDLHTGALSAAAGGFTTVVCMANTKPAIDNPETLLDLINRAGNEKIRVRFDAAVTEGLKGEKLTDFEKLAGLGACGFTDDGHALTDANLVAEAMRRAKALKRPLCFHEEDPALIKKSGRNDTAPAAAESSLIARDCALAGKIGATIDIQHVSSAASVEELRKAKAAGTAVFAEATPHHFSLTEDAVKIYGTNAKMNPPLRTKADRRAIIEGLKDDTIELIATDHAPHSSEEKNRRDFFSAPSGIIGLETALGLGITELVRPAYLSLAKLLCKMTVNPARLYRIDALARPASKDAEEKPYGDIAPGCAADLILFNPDEKFTAGPYKSKSENTPFTGWELYGKLHYTICRGKIVYRA